MAIQVAAQVSGNSLAKARHKVESQSTHPSKRHGRHEDQNEITVDGGDHVLSVDISGKARIDSAAKQ